MSALAVFCIVYAGCAAVIAWLGFGPQAWTEPARARPRPDYTSHDTSFAPDIAKELTK